MAITVQWEEGCAEPWIGNVLQALLSCFQSPTVRVLETGGFTGYTSAKLAYALQAKDELIVCDIDPARAGAVQAALEDARCKTTVVCDDVLKWIAEQPRESLDFVWVDDDHEKAHVNAEVEALLSKMKPGGLICFHDVFGVTDLQEVVKHYGGYSLLLPMLGPAGGLGLLQV